MKSIVAGPLSMRPVFVQVVGELRAANPSKCPRPWSKMLAQTDNPRVRDEGGGRGRSSTQDKKTGTVSTCWINPGGLSFLDKRGLAKKSPKRWQKRQSMWAICPCWMRWILNSCPSTRASILGSSAWLPYSVWARAKQLKRQLVVGGATSESTELAWKWLRGQGGLEKKQLLWGSQCRAPWGKKLRDRTPIADLLLQHPEIPTLRKCGKCGWLAWF